MKLALAIDGASGQSIFGYEQARSLAGVLNSFFLSNDPLKSVRRLEVRLASWLRYMGEDALVATAGFADWMQRFWQNRVTTSGYKWSPVDYRRSAAEDLICRLIDDHGIILMASHEHLMVGCRQWRMHTHQPYAGDVLLWYDRKALLDWVSFHSLVLNDD